MIPVTKPYLPSKEKYQKYLDGIWYRQWLTNNGPLVNEYELKLKEYLKVNHLLYVSNGTIALQIALKVLGIKNEVITTPFSYVATTSSLVWEGCEPIFVDIDPKTFNIDPNSIERAITDRTTAILATHCFGNPCDIESIECIAQKFDLKVIYDASHCFGTQYRGKSILDFGDISTLSLHATKLIHSVEGGALVTRNKKLIDEMSLMRNFGHNGPEVFSGVGINGKNSEFHAAMGLAVLEDADMILLSRKTQYAYYNSILKKLDVQHQEINKESVYNHSYYPVVFESEKAALKAKSELEAHEIYSRRYFFPLLSELDYVNNNETPNAKFISHRILCLPIYVGLSIEEQDMICRLLLKAQNNNSLC